MTRSAGAPGSVRAKSDRIDLDSRPGDIGGARRRAATVTEATPVAVAPGRNRALVPRPDGRQLLAIFVGGALGTLARAGLSEAIPHVPTAWPWSTFVVNVLACILLGYFVTRLQERLPLSSYRRPLWGTGLCGGLSTFSTMQVEIVHMLQAKAYILACGYAVTSIAVGYLAIHLTTGLVRRVRLVRA